MVRLRGLEKSLRSKEVMRTEKLVGTEAVAQLR